MNVLDQMLSTDPSKKAQKELMKIKDFPKVCLLLEKYYQEMKELISIGMIYKLDREKIQNVNFTTFHDLSKEIMFVQNQIVSIIACEWVGIIQKNLIDDFGDRGSELKLMLNQIAFSYFKFMQVFDDDFVTNLHKTLHLKTQDSAINSLSDEIHENFCLLFNGTDSQFKELDWRLKRTDWFSKQFILRRFFNNRSDEVVFHAKHKRLAYLAVLLRLMNKANLIEAEFGKSYMQMASKHIYCNDKQVSAHQLNKLACDILKNPTENQHIIDAIMSIIDAIKKA